ncbi:uracil-DNA glycosylase [Sphingomonas sp. MG17]|uniref:Uracil-DNA glycosylase n=1 Tax=Sphingomonas tagetis TaxID=2949092 RepID=A0A9X2KMT8_9SPHN|nr:uracil-DNA glycosylase [Sphingomonas tagetis]MCP3728998.1 uracil-DNA glycosylase [Sphingomonas tagetis]
MGIEGATDWREAAASALSWWQEAGVDTVVDEAPRDWTARENATPAKAGPAKQAPLVEEEVPLPATLEAFIDWRFGGDAPESAWGEPVVHVTGNPASPLMIVTDMPESGDCDAGALLTGDAGRLFDRMLAAIGHDRGSVYLVSLCIARPVTGQVPREIEEKLAELARHHVALAAPKRVLLLGQTVSRAILGADAGTGRGRLQPVNYQGGQSEAIATYHPRFLITKPAAKADAWKDLQLLIGGQNQ